MVKPVNQQLHDKWMADCKHFSGWPASEYNITLQNVISYLTGRPQIWDRINGNAHSLWSSNSWQFCTYLQMNAESFSLSAGPWLVGRYTTGFQSHVLKSRNSKRIASITAIAIQPILKDVGSPLFLGWTFSRIGWPHFGQNSAWSEIWLLQTGQLINGMQWILH